METYLVFGIAVLCACAWVVFKICYDLVKARK
jgi:hypothetical protein